MWISSASERKWATSSDVKVTFAAPKLSSWYHIEESDDISSFGSPQPYLQFLRSGNDEDIATLREQPCKHDLAGRGLVLSTDGSKLVRELDDLGEVVCIETRNVLGIVAFRDRLGSALYEQMVDE